MNDLQIKQLKVLEETIEYYSENTNRRCIENNSCSYSPEKANKVWISDGCAVGRLLEPELRVAIDNFAKTTHSQGVNNSEIFAMLPKEMRELTKDFLTELQEFHDQDYNWINDKGLSQEGEGKAEGLKDSIEKGVYLN